jgi:hypothetical protein
MGEIFVSVAAKDAVWAGGRIVTMAERVGRKKVVYKFGTPDGGMCESVA